MFLKIKTYCTTFSFFLITIFFKVLGHPQVLETDNEKRTRKEFNSIWQFQASVGSRLPLFRKHINDSE